MKNKLNKKGFTLVELLAVIVVLAIIMVIATQQINKTIARSRANSMISSLEMAANGAKTKIIDGSMKACSSGDTELCLGDVVSYDKEQYTIGVTESGDDWTITLTAVDKGQFSQADFTLVNDWKKSAEATTTAPAKGKINKINVEAAKKLNAIQPKISCTIDGTTGLMK